MVLPDNLFARSEAEVDKAYRSALRSRVPSTFDHGTKRPTQHCHHLCTFVNNANTLAQQHCVILACTPHLCWPANHAGDGRGESEVNEAYRAALRGHVAGTFDRGAKGAYMYELAKRADAMTGPGSRARQKRIMKELRALQVRLFVGCSSSCGFSRGSNKVMKVSL